MDAEQFGQFIHQQAVVEEQSRLDRAQQAQRTTQRAEIKKLVKRVRVADGSVPHLVREWIEDIEMCGPYINNDDASFRSIVEETIQGTLRRAYERFMSGQANRQAVTWAAIRTHVRAAFLTIDEDEYLRSQVERVRQTAYEGNVAYGRRFQETADRAYPIANRAPAEERIILTAYIKGLRNKDIVKRLVQETRPDTLAAALTAIEEFTADEERFKRYGWLPTERKEEPMEVSSLAENSKINETLSKLTRQLSGMESSFSDMADKVVQRKVKTTTSEIAAVDEDSVSQTLKRLEQSVTCMQKTFTKLSGVMERMQTAQESIQQPKEVRKAKPTPKGVGQQRIAPGKDPKTGKVTCFFCKKVGHYKKDCVKLKAQEPRSMECGNLDGDLN